MKKIGITKFLIGIIITVKLVYGGTMKCHRLFRPQFRKVNPSFVARIP